mmetsp:Transcript_65646/g.150453  ORF Transcript_65646/g.150453 Transcript_65646/m.150453 type:complete len:340 (+) Transcript_65646:23-1042(+)
MGLPCRPVLGIAASSALLCVFISLALNSRRRRSLDRLLVAIEQWQIEQKTCLRWLNILTMCRYGYASQPTVYLASATRLEVSRRRLVVEADQPLRCALRHEVTAVALGVSSEMLDGSTALSWADGDDPYPTLAALAQGNGDVEELIFAALAVCVTSEDSARTGRFASLLEAARHRLSLQLHNSLARPGPHSHVCQLVRCGRMREAVDLALSAIALEEQEEAPGMGAPLRGGPAAEEILLGLGEQEADQAARGDSTPENVEFTPPEELLAVLRDIREAQAARERWEGEEDALCPAVEGTHDTGLHCDFGVPASAVGRGDPAGAQAGFLAELEQALARRAH